jgi:glucan phosphorylase
MPPIASTRDGHLLVAYFSAEFGVDESLPIYSGGLGVLPATT